MNVMLLFEMDDGSGLKVSLFVARPVVCAVGFS